MPVTCAFHVLFLTDDGWNHQKDKTVLNIVKLADKIAKKKNQG